MNLLRGMGCSVFIAAECTRTVHGDRSKPLKARPVMSNGEWKQLAQGLTRFAEMVAGVDLQLVYHPHMGTVIRRKPRSTG